MSRDPWLTIRPRLYEADIADARVALDDVLRPADVSRVQGAVERIDTTARTVVVRGAADARELSYDALVLATGSAVHRPAIPGASVAHTVDTFEDATRLQQHIEALPATAPAGAPPFTAVVIGSGFTGIEIATSLVTRLRERAARAGAVAGSVRVILVERAEALAPELSAPARRAVVHALAALRVEWRAGVAVREIGADGVILAGGEWIPAATVVWAGGFRASGLAAQLGVARDALGRVSVDEFLRVHGLAGVYAAGDVARAVADPLGGHLAPMSCQCAIPMGELAGANAAAELLRAPMAPYSHRHYVTCLDLGDAGALFMEGWDREVRVTGFWAKMLKEAINTRLIYPPRPGHASRPGAIGAAA